MRFGMTLIGTLVILAGCGVAPTSPRLVATQAKDVQATSNKVPEAVVAAVRSALAPLGFKADSRLNIVAKDADHYTFTAGYTRYEDGFAYSRYVEGVVEHTKVTILEDKAGKRHQPWMGP